MAGCVCVVVGGMRGRWGSMCGRGACMAVSMCGRGDVCGRGACVAEGHAWQGHAWQEEGMHGGGMHDTHPPPTDTVIQSMNGWYASYWNAFLLEEVNFFRKKKRGWRGGEG